MAIEELIENLEQEKEWLQDLVMVAYLDDHPRLKELNEKYMKASDNLMYVRYLTTYRERTQ